MPEPQTPRATLLSIGDELLLGDIVDTNMPYISRQLLPLGITVAGSETVGDEIADIVAAFRRAWSKADIVIATGGLGPTDDDLTLEALAQAADRKLEFRAEVMEQMAQRLNRKVTDFSESNRKQAFVPQGSNILKNDWGTAPGVHLEIPPAGSQSAKHIFLMPGVPREMKGLLGERILPILRQRFPSRRALIIKQIHAYGIGESVIGERIKDLMRPGNNPNVGTRVNGGMCTVRLVATGATEEEALAALRPAQERVREAVKEGLFGEDDHTLASCALQALIGPRKTLALAESCTAGMIAALITELPGCSPALLEGAVVYCNEAKVRTCHVSPETLAAHGAVSAETARELAAGIRKRAGADIGLSVTGIAGPDGGSAQKPVGLVFFGIATEKGITAIERRYTGLDRTMVRERASAQALDLIRRAALGEY